MNLRATQPDASQSPRGGNLKFAYASGARPLAGYTIKRGVGRGGFGEVYYAVSDAGKEVALKLIRRNLDVELRGVTHCLNLKHPNLLALYDVRQDDQDNSWVVMEYVGGMSLEEALEQNPRGLPADEAMDWMSGIASGVAYLHDHGIVHRDLKPGNIFSDEGLVKLGDYGLSKFISCSRRSGQTESVGTVHYMAPEVANGRYGKEIDLYALGIILYEMLTGRVPFEGESVGEVLMKHLTAQPDVSLLAEPYRTVVARALSKDPDARYTSVEQFMAALPAPQTAPHNFASLRAPQSSGSRAREQESDVRLAEPQAGADAGQAAAIPIAVAVSDDEPVMRTLRELWRRLADHWAHANYNLPTKVVLSVAGIYILATNADWMLHALFALVAAYGAYRIVRAMIRPAPAPAAARPISPGPFSPGAAALNQAPAGPVAALVVSPKASPPPEAYSRYGRRQRWREAAVPAMIVKAPRERVADLTGSMLLSALVITALCVVMILLRGKEFLAEQYAWLALVSVIGSWAVLIPGKLWEGTKGEQVLRRFTMLVIGLGLGAAAYGIHVALLVTLPYDLVTPKTHVQPPASFYDASGAPLLYAYLTYFGFLFLAVRWWRQADPLRSTRLSIWATACSAMAAWMLNIFWPFPQPWGFMVAATISIAVQLASPWTPPRQRGRRQG